MFYKNCLKCSTENFHKYSTETVFNCPTEPVLKCSTETVHKYSTKAQIDK